MKIGVRTDNCKKEERSLLAREFPSKKCWIVQGIKINHLNFKSIPLILFSVIIGKYLTKGYSKRQSNNYKLNSIVLAK